MDRRKFLVGLGSASVGGSALLGSGAFSRVESHRAVTIAVAEDPNAYLGLAKCPDSKNGSYAHLDENGHLRIYMDDENPTIGDSPLGEGVNSNSTSWFDQVFQIRNQGKEDACVWISDDEENWPTVPEGEGYPDEGERRVEFYIEDDDETSLVGEDNAVPLPIGEGFCVGIKTRTYGLEDGDVLLDALDSTIVINADVNGDCFGPDLEAQCGTPAESCVDSSQGFKKSGGSPLAVRSDPTSTTGAPSAGSYDSSTENSYIESEFFSLGFGNEEIEPGFIELEFPGPILPSDGAPDLVIYESTNEPRAGYGEELADVYVTNGGDEYFVGQASSRANGTGVNEFDLDSLGPNQFDTVKIVDASNPDDFGNGDRDDGFDVDAVEACVAFLV